MAFFGPGQFVFSVAKTKNGDFGPDGKLVWVGPGKNKKDSRKGCLFAPPELEKLNLIWRDFRKIVKFIDDNKEWLLPMLETVGRKRAKNEG